MAGPYRPKPARKPGGRRPDPGLQKKDENELNINGQITAPQVRLVGDNIPEQGTWPLQKALRLADDFSLERGPKLYWCDFLLFGNGWLWIVMNGYVWFIAQIL